MSEENDMDMTWNSDKELAILISCIKSPLWIEGQDDFNIKCHIREFLQKCSGRKIVKMLKNVLSTEEKSALVKNELKSFFQSQAQSFENHMKVKNEPDFCHKVIKAEPISEESITFSSKFSAGQPSKYICKLKNQGNRNICAKSFEKEADFNEHRQVHFSKPYKCEICENEFAYKRIMQRHILTFHSKKQNKCLKRGNSVYNSKLHYKQILKCHVNRVHRKKKSVGRSNGKEIYEEAVKKMLHQHENLLVDNFENSEIEDWEGFIKENYGEKNCQNQPQSKEVSAIEPAKKKMKMTDDFSKSVDHESNLDFDVVKNLQQTDKAKKPKKSDNTVAKYVSEECQKEDCISFCMWKIFYT